MNQDDNIIEYEPKNARRFHITRRDGVSFGCFYFIRVLYALDATGKEWQEVTFAAVVGALTLPALALDVTLLVIMGGAKLLYRVACELLALCAQLITIVFNAGVGTLLKWLIPTLIILTIYLKWHAIKAFFDQLPL